MNNELVLCYLNIETNRKQIALHQECLEKYQMLKSECEKKIEEHLITLTPVDALRFYIETFASKKHAKTAALIDAERGVWSDKSLDKIHAAVRAWPPPEPWIDNIECLIKDLILYKSNESGIWTTRLP